MSCVSSVSTSILFNGGKLEPILPSRGICQGDPLSPYLFILCLDYLGQLIHDKCEENLWDPVKTSRSGPAFSHMFFADDLVLFAKANQVSCATIREVLDNFCEQSGQTINVAKSRVFFSPNVDDNSHEMMCDTLGFQATSLLGNYLGIPIKQPGSTGQDFNFVLDRVKPKLAGWKANLLSMAGRAVLIQSSLSTIPAYVMQCAQLLSKVLDNVDRINRNFLWGSIESVKKVHWVGWQKVTKPKSEGGLGFQTARGRNTALLAKLNWRFHIEKEALWSQVLRQKYCNHQRINSRNMDKLPCSQVWKGMKKGMPIFQKGVRWMPGRESDLSFWFDRWTNSGPLRGTVIGPLTQEEANLKVREVASMGNWDWSRLSLEIPLDIRLEIQATLLL